VEGLRVLESPEELPQVGAFPSVRVAEVRKSRPAKANRMKYLRIAGHNVNA
jgi:hypothetical protein